MVKDSNTLRLVKLYELLFKKTYLKVSSGHIASDSSLYFMKYNDIKSDLIIINLIVTFYCNNYFRSFSGYAMTWESYRKEFLKLEKAIGDPSKYDSNYLYTAGYDSPFTVFNRHNEVWLLAKDSTNDSTLYFSPSVN